MNESQLSALQLMQCHIETLYTLDGNGRLTGVNQWSGGVAPRFYLGRTPTGNVWRFRTDLGDELVEALEALCREEPVNSNLSHMPYYSARYQQMLSEHGPVERCWTGPAYWIAGSDPPATPTYSVDQSNVALLYGGLEAWIPDVPHRQPFRVAVEDGQAVSLCASARIHGDAHEAGVETVAGYRRRGYASSVVAAWAEEVRGLGAMPLYSTSWRNQASQRVAARVGGSLFGTDFHIT